MKKNKLSRRLFFKATGTTATALTLAPGTILKGQEFNPVLNPLHSMQQLHNPG